MGYRQFKEFYVNAIQKGSKGTDNAPNNDSKDGNEQTNINKATGKKKKRKTIFFKGEG